MHRQEISLVGSEVSEMNEIILLLDEYSLLFNFSKIVHYTRSLPNSFSPEPHY